jgi:hypothetical protein
LRSGGRRRDASLVTGGAPNVTRCASLGGRWVAAGNQHHIRSSRRGQNPVTSSRGCEPFHRQGGAFGFVDPLRNKSPGEGHRSAYGRDGREHRGSRAAGGGPRGRQSPEPDTLGLELGHGGVRRHHSQPQRRERLQESGFLHGERVLLLRDLGEPALGGAIFHIKRDTT